MAAPPDDPAGRAPVAQPGEPAVGPEVLELGSLPEEQPARRRRWVVILVVVAALIAGGSGLSAWLSATSPTFTTAEVVSLYSSPGPAAAGELGWDPSTIDSEEPENDTPPTAPQPAECRPVITFASKSAGVAQISVGLRSGSVADETREVEGTLITQLHKNPTRARTEYGAVVSALGRCAAFALNDYRVVISDVTLGQDRRARSDLSFDLAVTENRSTHYRFQLVRFGNALTWAVTEGRASGASREDEAAGARMPDQVVSGLQRIHRDRG